MGIQFRKSIQILPGVKLNISKSGLSVSAGVSGLHASINTKGQVRGTASIPGTGLRYTKTTKVSNLIPGAKEVKSEKKEKTEKIEKTEAPKKIETKTDKPAKESALKKPETNDVSEKKRLAQAIIDIYAIGDRNLDWVSIKNSSKNLGYENWDYLKDRAGKVLDGDLDTYLEIVNDINPFAELIELGSSFECSTDNPMKLEVLCKVNSELVLGQYKDDKELLEDYIAGTAIKGARDVFAILPVWQVEFTCTEEGKTVLNANFSRDSFEALNFAKIDASDTIRKLGGIISV